jgi:hypothetical protein
MASLPFQVQLGLGQGDLIVRDALAKEHDVRLDDAAAQCAKRRSITALLPTA